MRVTRSVALAAIGVLAAAGLAACGSGSKASTAGTSSTTVLNIGMPNSTQTNNSNPFLSSSAGSSLGYKYMIYEPIAMMNPVRPADPGKPWLATKWSWNTDYTQITITARDGVKWSDGQAFSAADIAYTFQLMKKFPALNLQSLAVSDATSTGNTATISFSQSQFVNVFKVLQTFVVPQHIWSTIANPATDTNQKPVGTGPYTLKSFTPQTIILDERDSYWQTLPKVKELRYTSYSGNDTQTTALVNGESEWSFVFIPNAKTVYAGKDTHYKLWFPPTLGIHGLWFNTTKAPLNNPILRRAIGMVINREDIFNQGESGYFYPQVTNITGIPTPAGTSFIASQYASQNVTVDVAGAKTLLTSNGYTYDGSTLKDSNGKAVTFTLSDPSGWSDYQTDLAIIQDNLKAIGVTAKVDKADENAWTKNVDTGNFDAVLHWTNGGATPYDLYQNIMDGAALKPEGTAGASGNYGRFNSPEATAAIKAYATASDEASRTAAMNTIEQIFVQQEPIVPLMAANAGGEYSTQHWVGWPDDANSYAPAQPTLPNALDIVLHLTPAS
jgi:peptide/nickel transport system substrate-binding protein